MKTYIYKLSDNTRGNIIPPLQKIREALSKDYDKGNLTIKELEDNMHYFSWRDTATSMCSYNKLYSNTAHAIIVTTDTDDIIGYTKIAQFPNKPDEVSVSILTTHKAHFNQGVSKLMITNIKKLMLTTFKNIPLATSEYSVKGFKYFQKNLQQMCEDNNIKLRPNKIGYYSYEEGEKNEFFELRDKHEKQFPKLYEW